MEFIINTENNTLTIKRIVKNSLSHYFHVFSGVGFIPINNCWYIVDSKTKLCFYLCDYIPVTKMYDLFEVLEQHINIGENAILLGTHFDILTGGK